MVRSLARGAALAGASMVALSAASAQSNLSTQGFGFPTGQFSSRALGTGGAIGELDPLSPVNPAALAVLGTRLVFFQIEPEFRTVNGPNGSEATTTARYPNVFGALPIGSSWMLSVGSSTLLDRTATTTFTSSQVLSPIDTVGMTTTFHVDGAMNDVRAALAWVPANWLRLGMGLHGIAGHNLITVHQAFSDTTQFSAFDEQRILGFGGAAVSAGVMVVTKTINASLSGRLGGTLHLNAQDTVISSARVPNRFGASFAYTGIANSMIAVRTSHDNWSSLGSLGSPGLKAVDSWDSSIGADVAGPRWGDRILFLRGGFRARTLPFQAAGHDVSENSVSGGLGTTFAGNHVLTDLGVIYANRKADIAATEHAWTLSFGISVRP